MLTDFPNP